MPKDNDNLRGLTAEEREILYAPLWELGPDKDAIYARAVAHIWEAFGQFWSMEGEKRSHMGDAIDAVELIMAMMIDHILLILQWARNKESAPVVMNRETWNQDAEVFTARLLEKVQHAFHGINAMPPDKREYFLGECAVTLVNSAIAKAELYRTFTFVRLKPEDVIKMAQNARKADDIARSGSIDDVLSAMGFVRDPRGGWMFPPQEESDDGGDDDR